MPTRAPISVLLVDDHEELLDLYKRDLKRRGGFRVTAATTSHKARSLAEQQLFDLVVIDAKLDYRNSEFGGLRLADDLKSRYGTNSILIMSRFITADWMKEYGSDYEFLDKHSGNQRTQFCARLAVQMRRMWAEQYVLVVMSFGVDSTRLYKQRIRPAVERMGLKCIRADEVVHNKYIPDVVFRLVACSKAVILVADGLSANAFYEAGFADALKKEVVILVRSRSDLPFDVAQRHAIEYGDNERRLMVDVHRTFLALRLNRLLKK
jgi:CheY-like chemotaxis protein